MTRTTIKNRLAATSARTRYEDDVYTWVQEQVELLRAGRLDEIDAESIAEELRDVGLEQVDKLENAIATLVQHILKWDYQPLRRSRSWELTIREQRRRVVRLLKKNPGLKARLAEALVEAYSDGRDRALDETGLPDAAIPVEIPVAFEEIMTREIVYEAPEPTPAVRRRLPKR
jgi:hypothetical protein